MGTELLVLEHTPTASLGTLRPVLAEPGAGPWRLVQVPAGDALPSDPDQLAGLLVLGGVMSAVDPDRHPWMGPEIELLTQAVADGVPVLGICLGAQLLGSALGGAVTQRDRPEVAAAPLVRTEEGRSDPLLAAWPDGTRGLFVHEDEVTTLPSGAVRLLSGSDGVAAWRLGSATAVQFHPEVDAAGLRSWLDGPALHGVFARSEVDAATLAGTWDREAPWSVAAGRDLLRRFLAGPVAQRRGQAAP